MRGFFGGTVFLFSFENVRTASNPVIFAFYFNLFRIYFSYSRNNSFLRLLVLSGLVKGDRASYSKRVKKEDIVLEPELSDEALPLQELCEQNATSKVLKSLSTLEKFRCLPSLQK